LPLIERLEGKLARWEKGKPTFENRRLIVSMKIGGGTQYLARVQRMPENIQKILTAMIWKFMWGGTKPPVAAETMSSDIKNKGGGQVLDLKA
jgi:hypothetical protein